MIRSLQSKTVAINDPVKKLAEKYQESQLPILLLELVMLELTLRKQKGLLDSYSFKLERDMCSNLSMNFVLQKQLPVKGDKYTWSPGKTAYESQNKIQEIIFGSELDMMQRMREGTFSSIVHYLDINTGKYEEFVYSLNDTWKDMVHLGSQTDLPVGQSSLSNILLG